MNPTMSDLHVQAALTDISVAFTNEDTNSVYDKEQFAEIVPKMGRYYPGSRPGRKQILPPGPRGNRGIQDEGIIDAVSTFLASINMNADGTFPYPHRPSPRRASRQ